MKLIIAGSRSFKSITHSHLASMMSIFPDLSTENLGNLDELEIVSGTAKGIDRTGEKLADMSSIKLKRFPAKWDEFGMAAGHIRNEEMALYADALLLVWDGESSGSANMKYQMSKLDKPVYEIILKNSEEPI